MKYLINVSTTIVAFLAPPLLVAASSLIGLSIGFFAWTLGLVNERDLTALIVLVPSSCSWFLSYLYYRD